MTLYELTGELAQLLQMAEDEDIDEQVLADTMEALNLEIEDKADAYAKVMQELDADAEKLKGEIKRLSDRKRTIENNIKRMKDSLKVMMETTGETKFKTDLFSFSIANNGGKRPIEYHFTDASELPEEFRKVKYEVDSDAVRERLESGARLDFAEWGERGTSLRIK